MTVSDLIEQLQKLDGDIELHHVVESLPSLLGNNFFPFELAEVMEMVEYIHPFKSETKTYFSPREIFDDNVKEFVDRGKCEKEDFKIIREFKAILI